MTKFGHISESVLHKSLDIHTSDREIVFSMDYRPVSRFVILRYHSFYCSYRVAVIGFSDLTVQGHVVMVAFV